MSAPDDRGDARAFQPAVGTDAEASDSMAEPDQDYSTIEENVAHSGSTSPKGSNASLSDPFEDDEFSSESSSPHFLRRSVSLPVLTKVRGVGSAFTAQQSVGPTDRSTSAEQYFRGLLAELKLEPTSTRLVSDNATLHASIWKESILLPDLDPYHPMDDYLVYLLRRERIHARNVILVSDNHKSHMLNSSFRSLMTIGDDDDNTESNATLKGDDEPSESSLNVEGIAEYFTKKTQERRQQDDARSTLDRSISSLEHESVLSISRLPAIQRRFHTSRKHIESGSLQTSEQETFPPGSYESQDISRLSHSILKDDSPNSVMDVLGAGVVATSDRDDKKKNIRNIGTESLVFIPEEEL